MYEVTVEASFCATHSLKLPDGSREPLHGHDWAVNATFASESLDETGIVVDFCAAQGQLHRVVESLHHTHLNDQVWFNETNPTAENVARAIFDQLLGSGPWKGKLQRVGVAEAPGCAAAYAVTVPPQQVNSVQVDA